MREDWEKSIDFVLRREGGYSNDKNDRGGETNWGISQRAYPDLDIKSLTVEQAKEIYLRDYWLPCSGDVLPWPFSLAVFDAAVNMGVGRSIRLLQTALDIEADGIIGPKTIEAVKNATPGRIRKLLALRMTEYVRIMIKDNSQFDFALNWSYRVLSLAELAWKGG